MMRFTITRDEFDSIVDGTLWLVRSAEFIHDADCIGCAPKPPVEFVEATKLCSCHEGRLWVQTSPDNMDDFGPCPDCRIDLIGDCREDGHPDGYECPPECDQAPILGSAYPASEVLSVVDRRMQPLTPDNPVILLGYNGPSYWSASTGHRDVALPPAVHPGMFALKLAVQS